MGGREVKGTGRVMLIIKTSLVLLSGISFVVYHISHLIATAGHIVKGYEIWVVIVLNSILIRAR